jgi:ferrous iron transport protein B
VSAPVSPTPAPSTPIAKPLVHLIGNPNAGKTTLFNRLAGTRARTGNYPGVTVERRAAPWRAGTHDVELVDLPGTYSLTATSPEERIAAQAILRDGPAAIVLVLDATSLQRGLYLAVQLRDGGAPLVVALNMMDEARAAGLDVDVAKLGAALGATVVPIVAARGEGLDALAEAVAARLVRSGATDAESQRDSAFATTFDDATEADVAALAALEPNATAPRARLLAQLALLADAQDEDALPAKLREAAQARRRAASEAGRDLDLALIGARYAVVDRLAAAVLRTAPRTRSRTDRIDAVLVHPVLGLLVFAAVMFVVFEALFRGSEPAVALIEDAVAGVQGFVAGAMPGGPLRDLLTEGVVAGVGNVVVFVPQIALLFFLITALEDSGYLARVAFVIDRVMGAVGLHGKTFVPLLSGFACAVPAVMSTRTIASRKDRLVTMLALPLMSCSARLPIYVLVIATVFAGAPPIGGIVSVGAAALFGMYVLSVLATLGAAAVLRRTVLRGPRPTLVLELPPYRLPLLGNLLRATWGRVREFLVEAGTVILALTIVLWAVLSFPRSEAIEARRTAERTTASTSLEGEAREARLTEIDDAAAAAQLEHSLAGRLGKFIEPAIAPLGMDWRMGIGVIGSFAAREVFVSTLGIVFGIGASADEENQTLRERLRDARRSDGSRLFTPLSGFALMIFFVLACQCMSTIAVVRRESGSWRWPLFMLAYMSALAYVVTLAVYQIGSALGWGLT